jgi:hypothetical protein
MEPKFHYKKMQIFICIFFTTFFCKAQQSFDTLVNYSTYGEFPYSIYQAQDSGYIYLTSGDDYPNNTYWMEFSKMNTDGSVSFHKIFGFPGHKLYCAFSSSLKPTFDGGWAFGGAIQYPNTSSVKPNGILVKYNTTGDTEFVKIIGDTSSDVFYDCIQTSDSGFVSVGDRAKYSPNINNDFWIVKTDVNGGVLWERTLGNSLDEQSFHVIENSQHQLVVSGAKENGSMIHYPFVAVYDLQGNLITTKSFNQGALLSGGGGAIWHYGVTEYLLTAALDTVINVNDYAYPEYVARLDSGFHFKWKAIYNSPEEKDILIMKEISDGGIVLVGFKDDSISGAPLGWIAKMDSSGNKLWEHFYSHSWAFNYFSDFQETFDHGFIVCGTTWDSIANNQDSWIVKLDSNGCLDTNCGINIGTIEIPVEGLRFTVFPNPVKDELTVQSLKFKEGSILKVYDMLGKEIYSQSVTSLNFKLQTSNWHSGIYLLQLQTGTNVFTKRVVKE